jgi:hypothetical protein
LDKFAALPTGTKLVLVAGVLLFFDLFLTWQSVEVDFGGGNTVSRGLDGWDFWGLLIGLLTLALLAVVIIRETESEVMLEARWDVVPLALACVIFAMAIVKNIRDEASAWPSYLGIALAGVMIAGAAIEWARNRSDESPVQAQWQPQPAGPSDASPIATDRRSDEPRW